MSQLLDAILSTVQERTAIFTLNKDRNTTYKWRGYIWWPFILLLLLMYDSWPTLFKINLFKKKLLKIKTHYNVKLQAIIDTIPHRDKKSTTSSRQERIQSPRRNHGLSWHVFLCIYLYFTRLSCLLILG